MNGKKNFGVMQYKNNDSRQEYIAPESISVSVHARASVLAASRAATNEDYKDYATEYELE